MFNTRLQRQSVIACVIIGHQIAAIITQQAQRHLLRTTALDRLKAVSRTLAACSAAGIASFPEPVPAMCNTASIKSFACAGEPQHF